MRLLRPEEHGFAEATRKPFIAHFSEPVPAAVARCAEPADVAEAVAYARRHAMPLAIRSGGHLLWRQPARLKDIKARYDPDGLFR